MKAARYLILAAVVSAAMATAAESPRVTFQSLGPARIGMSKKALAEAIGSELKSDSVVDDGECEYAVATRGYRGVSFMFLKDRLARIDVSEPTVATLSGAHVGSTKASVLALYRGRIEVSPHTYVDEGSYLTMFSADKRYGIRFETDGDKVTSYYAGTAEAVQYVEGCL